MKYRNNLLFTIIYIIVFYLPITVNAQSVSFTASASKTTVQVGEQFKVTFSINAKSNGFSPPQFTGFTVISGPNPSTQSSVQIINGDITQTTIQSYSYVLEANKEGSYTIGSASITSGNTIYKSNPLVIKVVKGQQQSSVPPSTGSGSDQKQQTDIAGSSDELFIRTYVSKNKVYKGEQIVLTHKLYTTLPRVDLIDIKPPSYSGFWSEQIDESKTITPQNEVLNGKTYRVAEISKTVLFPQKDGTLRIEPIQVECQVQVVKKRKANGFFEEMFYGPDVSYYASEKRKIKSNPLSVTVDDLPLQGKPSDFTGAVGDFNISAEINRSELKANEALDFKITVSGSGNIKLIDKLPVNFPPDFEVYDPKIIDDIYVSGSGVSGKRIFNYVVIPLNEGEFKLDPINFTFFNPKTNKYVTLTTPLFNIKVGKGYSSANQIITSSQQDIKYLNSDIRYIKVKPFVLNKMDNIFWGSDWYFVLFTVPPFLFVLFMLAYRKQMQLKGNVAYVRNRQARKIAKLRLKKAKQFMDANQKEEFFVEIGKALWGYTADKFNIPLANLSLQTVKDIMMQKNVQEDKQNLLINLLEECEFARFAPGDSTEKMKNLYDGAINVITTFES